MENQNKTYIELLIDITTKKEKILSEMILKTIKQSSCLKQDEFDEDLFDSIYKEKEQMIKEIQRLDDGFHQIYGRISEELKKQQVTYEKELKRLQGLIRSVADKGIQVQRLETENRVLCEERFSSERRKVKDMKISKKTASMYYKNMMGLTNQQSFFYDKSK